MAEAITFGEWLPMDPAKGPPLPKSMGILWPWVKPEVPPVEKEEVPYVAPVTPVYAPVYYAPAAPPAAPITIEIIRPPAEVPAYEPPVYAPPVYIPPEYPAPPPYEPPVYEPPVYEPPVYEPPVYPPEYVPPVPKEVPIQLYTLNSTPSPVGGGSITPKEGDFLSGTRVGLVATPYPGYEFDHWGGDVSGTRPATVITMDGDKSVIAYFRKAEVPTPPVPKPPVPKLPPPKPPVPKLPPYEAPVELVPKVAPPPEVAPPAPPPPEVPPRVPPSELTNLRIVRWPAALEVGDTCTIRVSFNYVGPRISRRLYAAIGNIRAGYIFDEVIHGSKAISIPETISVRPYYEDVGIRISTAIRPGTYDLYAKVDEVMSRYLEDVITIKEVAPPPAPPPPVGYTLSVLSSPLGAGWVTKEPDKDKYTYGEIVKLTARSAPGYEFASWEYNTDIDTGNPAKFLVTKDLRIKAYFIGKAIGIWAP